MAILDLDHLEVALPCPRCSYLLEVEMLDVRTQVWRWCPCCRSRVRLMEPDGTVSSSVEAAEQVMAGLLDSPGGLFR